jgi:3-dehydroquinate dehydratase-2
MTRVLVLQGPNLNLLGIREPSVYGTATLADVASAMDGVARELGLELDHVQSNHEGVLIDAVHAAASAGALGAVVNPAAYTHTSVALRDAFLSTRLPFVEVHLSNVAAREPFRQRSLFADVAVGSVIGLGAIGYELALRGLVARLGGSPRQSGV